MKRLMKGLLCAACVSALAIPEVAVAQHERHTARPAQQSQTRPARTTVRKQVTRTTRVRTERVSRPRTVVRQQVTVRTHRIGVRPSHFRPIRRPAFVYPRGYSYRRFRTGLLLPRLFLSPSYYFYDWAALGLGPPPPGYIWVRYGPDLLLVNRRTGRVVDVIYGAFIY